MIDDLRTLAIFAEIVRQKSFRGAAKLLNLSPSVVSYHVTQLEKRLGISLLYRSTRKISLTHEGEILYRHAVDMLSCAQQGLSKISSVSPEPTGRLIVALPSVITRASINRKIADFCKKYPGIDYHFHYTDIRQDMIGEGIDLAIRVGKLEDSTLKSKRIGRIDRKLVCSTDFFSHHKQPKHPEELASWKWIKLEMLPSTRSLIRDGGEVFHVTYESYVSVDSVEAMTQFCLHGLGLATPPDYLVTEALENGKLVEILPEWQVEPLPLFALWPDNLIENSNSRRLLDHLVSTEEDDR